MRRELRAVAPTAVAALMTMAACASAGRTSDTSPDVSRSTVVATTVTTPHSLVGPLGQDSILAVRACIGALVDDPNSPGAGFVDKVRKLSVGYTLVEPLDAAQKLCAAAARQLQGESPEPGTSAADLLTANNDINTAIDLATEQIRTDAFYKDARPAQFIPDGAAALQRSIAVFYSRASFTLRL